MSACSKADGRVLAATEQDWATEYLDAIVAVRMVAGLEAAVDHIRRYGSQHTDAIVTEDSGRRRTIPDRGRQRHRPAQRLDPVRRRRRIRLRRRNRHRHRQAPCPRAGGPRAADDLQVQGPRQRTGPSLRNMHNHHIACIPIAVMAGLDPAILFQLVERGTKCPLRIRCVPAASRLKGWPGQARP